MPPSDRLQVSPLTNRLSAWTDKALPLSPEFTRTACSGCCIRSMLTGANSESKQIMSCPDPQNRPETHLTRQLAMALNKLAGSQVSDHSLLLALFGTPCSCPADCSELRGDGLKDCLTAPCSSSAPAFGWRPKPGWDRLVSLGVSVSVPSRSIQFWAFREDSM